MGASPQRQRVAGMLLVCAMTGVCALFGTRAAIAQPRPAVVELFTSEGCSSCPPAETFLGELAHRHDVLALAYHVDYWDELGWRDRFGLTEAVNRQAKLRENPASLVCLHAPSRHRRAGRLPGQRSCRHRQGFGGESRWRRHRAVGTRWRGPDRPRRAVQRGAQRYRARGLPTSSRLSYRAGRERRTNAHRVQYRAHHPHPWSVGWQGAAIPGARGLNARGCHRCCRPRAARRSGAYHRGGGPHSALRSCYFGRIERTDDRDHAMRPGRLFDDLPGRAGYR